MKWFNECLTMEDVKDTYKKLAKKHHPDLGGDNATMQEIKKEYAFASAKVLKGANLSQEETDSAIHNSEEYRKAIEAIIYLEGIEIEVVGFWIWVTGDTYPVKSILKEAGFFFASKKKMWYYRAEEYKCFRGGKNSMDDIRNKYGSEPIRSIKRKAVT